MAPHKCAYVGNLERFSWRRFYLLSVASRVVYTEMTTGVLRAVPLPLVPNMCHIPKLQVEHPRADGMHFPPAGSVLHMYRTFLAMARRLGTVGRKKKICFLIPGRHVVAVSYQGGARAGLLYEG